MKSQRTVCEDVFGPGKPHFFKVIVKDTIRDKRLVSPSYEVCKPDFLQASWRNDMENRHVDIDMQQHNSS
ncbi:hypothetical protein LINGRAPRIM_LOCUS427 [Linum grandiflorum]